MTGVVTVAHSDEKRVQMGQKSSSLRNLGMWHIIRSAWLLIGLCNCPPCHRSISYPIFTQSPKALSYIYHIRVTRLLYDMNTAGWNTCFEWCVICVHSVPSSQMRPKGPRLNCHLYYCTKPGCLRNLQPQITFQWSGTQEYHWHHWKACTILHLRMTTDCWFLEQCPWQRVQQLKSRSNLADIRFSGGKALVCTRRQWDPILWKRQNNVGQQNSGDGNLLNSMLHNIDVQMEKDLSFIASLLRTLQSLPQFSTPTAS